MCVLGPGRIKILKGLIFTFIPSLSAYFCSFYGVFMVQSLAEDIVSTAQASVRKGLASCFGAFVTFCLNVERHRMQKLIVISLGLWGGMGGT